MKTIAFFIMLMLALLAGAEPLQIQRWDTAKVRVTSVGEIDGIINRIMANRGRYVSIDIKTGVPWYVVGSLHNLESGGSFRCHLHEGSPLTARTRYVPKGRPLKGNPPFTWEESALDALLYDKLDKVAWIKLNDTLYAIESYNGLGMLKYHSSVPTPYLWSGTTIYSRGKYVKDGVWSSTAVSGQIGVAAIFKRMEERGLLSFNKLQR